MVRRRLRRADVLPFFEQLPRSLVGLEACASGHYWARAIAALGHTVRLMPPAYVKPYVKRGKTDAADAEAICEAVTRPTMRFVAIKTEEQQATLMLHKARDLLVRQRTMLTNALRAHLAEHGAASAQGVGGVGSAIKALHEDQANLAMLARFALHGLVVSCAASKSRSRRSRRKSSSGIGPTRRAGGWRRSPASARSQRARSPRVCPAPRCSGPVASSWPSWG